MAKGEIRNIAAVTQDLYGLLQPLAPEERQRSISAALTLLGDQEAATSLSGLPNVGDGPGEPGVKDMSAEMSARKFFDQKDPNTKMEALAVAARFREQFEDAHDHKMENIK